ncbi:D-tyrosyl-tRNA(Tyr) deacylase [Bifidobacterium imperatoris]|uniref:D-aminoacyl-tRNA deacylase n=2 Tax=Bifidobacterium imperatoris TaxID=2020965 RepID=A0A2N5IQE3_9BIFI|nr:D-tyrosyl-tRNA(Tyr) deacylase [Bifidobacterium imperatoris]
MNHIQGDGDAAKTTQVKRISRVECARRSLSMFRFTGDGIIGHMRIVIQRVSHASVDVVNELGTLDPTFEPQQIGPGYMILVGVSDADGDAEVSWLAHKVLNLRVFEDEQGKMNRSIQDIGGEILSLSQFTLYADVHKGNRPSFIKAGKPEHADITWIKFNEALRSGGVPVREGRFGAHMRVGLVNDGPVTIIVDTETDMPHKK